MRKSLAAATLAAVVSFGPVDAVFASSAAPAAAEAATDDDDGGNAGLWGLLGLAGLAGLAGLKRRDTNRRYDTTGSSSISR
jgi:MYXO-CTERM domain-containing protein